MTRVARKTHDGSGISDRTLHDALSAKGYVTLAQKMNPIKAKSRKDKLGQIALRKMTGPANNAAYRTAREFETRTGGIAGLAEKLEALGDQLPKDQLRLARALRDQPRRGLAQILAEQQVSLIQTMKSYAKGCVELAQVDAAIEMHRGLPAVVKDIVRHALDTEEVCFTCVGTGTLREKSTDNKEKLPCKSCRGTGRVLTSSQHKEWAAKAVLNATGQAGEKVPQTAVQVNVAVGGGRSYAERVIDLADRVLHGQKDQAGPVEDGIVEGEVVGEA